MIKFKLKRKYLILTVFNMAAVIMIIILNVFASKIAESQQYNYSSYKWDDNENMDYTHISCFISSESKFTENDIEMLRISITAELNKYPEINETNGRLFIDSYCSSEISADVTAFDNKSINSKIIAVGGDFFHFRDFQFLSGTYFSDDDLMQDNAVIDNNLAWQLFGSYDIAGMYICLNGVNLRISGVVQTPDNKYEKNAYGNTAKIYVSYHIPELIYPDESDTVKDTVQAINVVYYECILPEPLEDVNYNFLKTYFETNYSNEFEIIKNTERFNKTSIQGKYKSILKSTASNSDIEYPFWENGSRLAEIDLTEILMCYT